MSEHNSSRPSPSVLRVMGPRVPARSVRAEVRQTQWLRALFAYAELHANPSLEVRPELEAQRTVSTLRWHSHRELLQAHAALTSNLPRPALRSFRRAAGDLVRAGAFYQRVETELGEFQTLDAAQILANCPFLWRTELGTTYWSGDEQKVPADETGVEPCLDVSLSSCRALAPRPSPEGSGPFCVSVCVFAPPSLLASNGSWVSARDLSFGTSVQRLEAVGAAGVYLPSHPELVEGLPLVGGRAAWAVAVRLEEELRSPLDASAALSAALKLVAQLSVSAERRVPTWQQGGAAPRILAVADVVRDAAVSVLTVFECVQRCFFAQRVPPGRDRYLFDSKHFCAKASGSVRETLSISGARYSVSLGVELHETPVSDPGIVANDQGMRASTVRLRTGRRQRVLTKKSS